MIFAHVDEVKFVAALLFFHNLIDRDFAHLRHNVGNKPLEGL
jgi:hypothetical protein